MRTMTFALAVAGALITIPSTASALSGAPLGHRAGDLERESESEQREQRREQRVRRRERAFAAVAVPAALASIAACESGGNPQAVGGGGLYRGKYQFDLQTWAAVGGSGDPAAASEAEQDMRAALLYARAGPSPWPVCG